MHLLKNTGNQCYFNTALHLFFSLVSFHSELSSCTSPVCTELSRIRETHDPSLLYSRYIKKYNLPHHVQEDCSETVHRLIDMLHDEMKIIQPHLTPCVYWNDIGESFIKQTLYGLFVVVKTQPCCQRKTATFEMFVSIDIFDDNAHTNTVDMFKHVFNEEIIAQVTCDDCHRSTSFTKHYLIYHLPKVLLFHFIHPRSHFHVQPSIYVNTHLYIIRYIAFYNHNHYYCMSYDILSNKYYIVSDETIICENVDMSQTTMMHDIQLIAYEAST
jgi:ubiquitin C-terminal hydrolase